jgi:hypothetical protein
MRVNWLAVLVSAILYWVLQAAWFTVFSQQWESGLRMRPEEIAAYKAHPNFWPYLIAFACNLVLAFIIARVLALGGVWTIIRGFRVGLLIGLAIALAMLTEMHFELKSYLFIWISVGCPLAGCILTGLILGTWKPKARFAE